MAMRGHACPECGASLDEATYGNGTVWSCGAHGVKRWVFDDAARDLVLLHGRPGR